MFSKTSKRPDGPAEQQSQASPRPDPASRAPQKGSPQRPAKSTGRSNSGRVGSGKPSMPSIVSDGLHVTGNLISDGDVQIDGTIEGDVKGRNLTVGANGSVVGKIMAHECVINGHVVGEIASKTVMITRTARVESDIVHEVLSIEAGAVFEGRCKRSDSIARPEALPDETQRQVLQHLSVKSERAEPKVASGAA